MVHKFFLPTQNRFSWIDEHCFKYTQMERCTSLSNYIEAVLGVIISTCRVLKQMFTDCRYFGWFLAAFWTTGDRDGILRSQIIIMRCTLLKNIFLLWCSCSSSDGTRHMLTDSVYQSSTTFAHVLTLAAIAFEHIWPRFF